MVKQLMRYINILSAVFFLISSTALLIHADMKC